MNVGVPVIVQVDEDIELIACGSSHTLIYKSTRKLFDFGNIAYRNVFGCMKELFLFLLVFLI